MTPTSPAPSAASPDLPNIAVAGLSLEASTYSPAVTTAADLNPRRGTDVLDRYEFLRPGTELREAAHWHPVLQGRGIPGGPVPMNDYLALKDEILAGLAAAGPLDGMILDLHGAMSVIGLDDAEGDLAAAVRATVGPDTLISTGMDLHGNVSWRLAQTLDLLTCYRMAPHEDALETKERAVRNLLTRLAVPGRPKPLKAWIPVPVLLPGEKTSTRIEPAKTLYSMIPQIEGLDGVLDAGIWIGYAWADEPRNRAVVMVTGDDEAAVVDSAERVAAAFWDAHADFAFVAPTGTLDECLTVAAASAARPYFISDSGDNPTAGGAGDVSWTLGQLLERPEIADGRLDVIYASIPDAAAVEQCRLAGVGATVELKVGAVVDPGPAAPVPLHGVVEHIHDGDPAAHSEVVVRAGGLRVILTAARKPYHLEEDFTRNGLDPRAADVVVVKIGYLEPELFDMAADWTLALTPGGVDQDLPRLGHHRIQRPMHPFDSGMDTPDLHARLVPASHAAPSEEPRVDEH